MPEGVHGFLLRGTGHGSLLPSPQVKGMHEDAGALVAARLRTARHGFGKAFPPFLSAPFILLSFVGVALRCASAASVEGAEPCATNPGPQRVGAVCQGGRGRQEPGVCRAARADLTGRKTLPRCTVPPRANRGM